MADVKVADRMARTMHDYGVRFAFGIPGNDVLELVRACEGVGIRFIVAKSEPSAAFMADAVTHVTGAPAACIFALGPGIANGASGVAGALMERSPVIVLGGEMAGNRREIYNHQAFDHVAMMRPVTKYAAELNPQRAAQQTARALDIAHAHPRGPVFLNCPADATRATSNEPETSAHSAAQGGVLGDGELSAVTAALASAQRPVALIGCGAVAGAAAAATAALVEAWRLPFFATYKAKGILPEDHPLCLGAVALSPVVDDISLGLIRDSDLLLLIGFDPIELRDAWLDAWPQSKQVLSIDWSPALHRIFPVGRQLVGDVPAILAQLSAGAIPANRWEPARLSQLRQQIAHVVRPRDPDGRISPAALFGSVSRQVTPETLLSIDVGAHRILGNHVLACRSPGQLLQSNGLGCMGYAIPAAIGAALAAPGRPAIAMLGDGCALMSLGELALVAELELPVVTVVLNDDSLALIELKQSKMNMARQGVGFKSPQFAQIAQGFGIAAQRVTTVNAFADALLSALAKRRPALIEAMVDPQEYWEQM